MKKVFYLVGLFCFYLYSQDFYYIPLMKKTPKIDGFIDEKEWEESVRFDGFSHGGKLEPKRIIGYIGANEENIYIGIMSELPNEGEILKNINQETEKIVFDDAIEVWIDPYAEKDDGVTFQMLSNSLGYAYYLTHPRGNVKSEQFYGWKGNYKIVNGFHNKWWHCEIEIPIKNLVKDREITNGLWQINICRDFKQPWAWASIGNESYAFTAGNKIFFKFSKDDGLITRQKHLKDPLFGDIEYIVEFYNPTNKKIEFNANILLKRDIMPEIVEKREVVLNPGEKNEMKISVKDYVTNKFELETKSFSKDGKEIYFSRKYKWDNWKEAKEKWQTKKVELPPVDFVFAYYPYLNKIKILADISRIPTNAKFEKMDFKIRKEDSREIIKEFNFNLLEFEKGKCEKTIELPPLSGNYEIVAYVIGKDVPSGEIIKKFERKVFEWERNNLGKSRKVYPPFTPIKKIGNKLYTVLKEYEVNSFGLLKSIITENQERDNKKQILFDEMKYICKIDGQEYKPEKGEMKYKEVSEDRVIFESKFNIGKQSFLSKGTLDYDGTLRIDLTLFPSNIQIESLILEIPIKEEVGKMVHAMADGIRYPIYTGYVPEGEGIVWDSTKIVPSSFPKNFCTYIFIGTPKRGISWFAENDKGWSWDTEKPNMQILKTKGVVKLQINFINKPIKIEQAQTITFGILAAPVKPYLSGWRHRWFTENFSLLGTDINWFALGDCGSVYPAGKDMYLWEMLKKGNTRHLSDEEINKVIEHGKKYFEPYGKNKVESFVRHVKYNLRARYGTKIVFYYNRGSYAAAEEFQTFMDEWCLNDYNSYRSSKGIWEIKIVPTESYIDHALYWYKKSFEIAGNKGVYWDNYFFIPSYNTMMTSAYKKQDGTIMPSTGLWGLRELVKRTFVMMNELGMEPIVMVHMTSTQILPLYSFATVQYDWEWKYSQGDVQTRFPREYIQLVSTGELAGLWPVLLGDHGALALDPWTQKTFIGVTLIHDLLGPVSTWVKPLKEIWDKYRVPFLEMAKNENMVAYRYWDEKKQPVYTKNLDLPGIVYSIPKKKALYAVVSFCDKDVTEKIYITPEILGFKNFKVVDVDNGEIVPVENNTFEIFIKKHDLKVFEIVAQ
ncbi:MAG: hypothetical protein NC827_08060 [Candidatus Omnitrophica bacterium]|nr:hypothetical protein [Candidatus Omnitrophota bacterium]MCM8803243.1 hypothetical protein [Candidatus Omnitrophota bacterium]